MYGRGRLDDDDNDDDDYDDDDDDDDEDDDDDDLAVDAWMICHMFLMFVSSSFGCTPLGSARHYDNQVGARRGPR